MGQRISRRTLVASSTSAIAFSVLGANYTLADDKPTITVGSANYTEQFVMAEFIALLLEDAGYPVQRELNLGGTAVAQEALMNGEIDTYGEYTGTAYMAILGHDLPKIEDLPSPEATGTPDDLSYLPPLSREVYTTVRDEYREKYNIEWLEPFGYNNTYAMAVRPETAEKHDLKTFSDLEPYAGDMILGTDQEFPVRPDGLPGYEEAYGYEFKDVVAGDIGLMYDALDQGEVDVITAYTTDGRIKKLGLVVLEDDKHFFPPYNSCPLVRIPVLEDNPGLYDIINQLAGKIDEEEMASVNFRVDEDGLTAHDAAQEFLVEKGFLKGDS